MVEQVGLPDAAVTPQAIDVDWPQAWPADLPDDVRRTINAHLANREPINAVKVDRQATGAGLADAKRAIDHWPGA